MNLPSEQPHSNLAARSNEQTEDLFNSGTLGARAGGAHMASAMRRTSISMFIRMGQSLCNK